MEEFRCCKTISKGLNFTINISLTMGSKLLGYEECKVLFGIHYFERILNFLNPISLN
jgi:hypothetical protein